MKSTMGFASEQPCGPFHPFLVFRVRLVIMRGR